MKYSKPISSAIAFGVFFTLSLTVSHSLGNDPHQRADYSKPYGVILRGTIGEFKAEKSGRALSWAFVISLFPINQSRLLKINIRFAAVAHRHARDSADHQPGEVVLAVVNRFVIRAGCTGFIAFMQSLIASDSPTEVRITDGSTVFRKETGDVD